MALLPLQAAPSADDFTPEQNAKLDAAHLKVEAVVEQVLADGVIASVQYWTTENGGATAHLRKTIEAFIEMSPGGLVDGDKWQGPVWRIGSYKAGTRTLAKFTSDPRTALSGL